MRFFLNENHFFAEEHGSIESNELPNELINHIAEYLEIDGLGKLAQSSHACYEIVKKIAKKWDITPSTYSNIKMNHDYFSYCDPSTQQTRHLKLSQSLTQDKPEDKDIIAIDGNHYGSISLNKNGTINTKSQFNQNTIPKDFFQNQRVEKVFARDNSYYALTVEGQLFAWGDNSDGQLANGTRNNVINPVLVSFFEDKIIKMIAVGGNHVLALDSENILYGWGNNRYGQLGLDSDQSFILSPEKITFFDKKEISHIYAGWLSSFVCLSQNKTYAFGFNQYKNLGLGKNYPVFDSCNPHVNIPYYKVPQEVRALSNVSVVMIVSTGFSSYALTSKGELFVWGAIDIKKNIIAPAPIKLKQFENKKVRSFAARETNHVVLTEDNEVYNNFEGVNQLIKDEEVTKSVKKALLLHNKALRQYTFLKAMTNDSLNTEERHIKSCAIS